MNAKSKITPLGENPLSIKDKLFLKLDLMVEADKIGNTKLADFMLNEVVKYIGYIYQIRFSNKPIKYSNCSFCGKPATPFLSPESCSC